MDALQSNRRLKILHVTEAFGGGVATAIAQYRRNYPSAIHHVLANIRTADYQADGELQGFDSVSVLPAAALSALRQVRETAKSVDADIVHAHSSLAGLYVRIALRRSQKLRLIYTPHGFAFERRDVHPLTRFLFYVVERGLAFNTSVFGACSPREETLCNKMSRPTVYVPNVAGTGLDSNSPHDHRHQPPLASIFHGGRLRGWPALMVPFGV